MKFRRPACVAAALVLLTAGGALLSEEVWLRVKARIASEWIETAFEAHLADGEIHRPWGWADMHPVARLEAPRLGIRRTVLSGATGASLAFGPGHVHGTAPPNGPGHCVLAGHRDGWFAFLRDLRVGDEVRLQTHGRTRRYAIVDLAVVSQWDAEVTADDGEEVLTLITCYPFDGLTAGSRRYVVRCAPIEA